MLRPRMFRPSRSVADVHLSAGAPRPRGTPERSQPGRRRAWLGRRALRRSRALSSLTCRYNDCCFSSASTRITADRCLRRNSGNASGCRQAARISQRLDDPWSRSVEVGVAVSDVDLPGPHGRPGFPRQRAAKLRELFQRSVERKAARADQHDIRRQLAERVHRERRGVVARSRHQRSAAGHLDRARASTSRRSSPARSTRSRRRAASRDAPSCARRSPRPEPEAPDDGGALSRSPERLGDARDVGPDVAETGRVQVDDANVAIDELWRPRRRRRRTRPRRRRTDPG